MFISYAQNFEDVLLWRALSHIHQGFYIDIGAHDPSMDSVSRAFYEHGWRGVHVEPVPRYAKSLLAARPDEEVVEAAVATTEGTIAFFDVLDTGLGTGKADVAALHRSEGFDAIQIEVQTIRLATLLDRYADRDIHWLKIDVEEMERDVLQSWSPSLVRPWVVVIESTVPRSPEPNFSIWEPLIVDLGYEFVYFDGLNRFYVHETKMHLKQKLRFGANVFDEFNLSINSFCTGYIKAEMETLTARLHSAEAMARSYRETNATVLGELALKNETIAVQSADADRLRRDMEDAAAAHAQEVVALQTELAARGHKVAQLSQAHALASCRSVKLGEEVAILRASTSWRITAPLRVVSRAVRWLIRDPRQVAKGMRAWITFKPGTRPRRVLRAAFAQFARLIQKNPRLAQLAKRIGAFLPNGFHQRLMMAAANSRRPDYDAALTSIQICPMQTSPLSNGSDNKRRVAVVAPVSPGGTTGGAERLYDGLVGAIRDLGWAADLVTLPFDESSFEAIQAGYAAFEALDLNAYDLVISTKAPSYCVKHRNHVLYLVHTIRVFYDMFETAFPDADESRLAQRRWIQEKDNEALGAIERRYAIGEEVTCRLDSFNGLDATTLHPGLNMQRIVAGPIGDYFFMPGRLHRWKRVNLAIEAIKASDLPMKLVIAGTGEDEAALRALADGDKRIVFAGHVDDARLANLYQRCLGVVFCPVREDYGYVTIEAFAYAKPVITCFDSGEPLQFIRDGETGFVAEPDVQGVRKAMERLWADRDKARKMGLEASDVARDIAWEKVAKILLDPVVERDIRTALPKLKVAVLDMQPITPAVGGGRLRLYGLYHDLGEQFETRYVGSYDWPGEEFRQEQLTPSLKEIVVPLSAAHHQVAEEAKQKSGGRVVIDMLFGVQGHLSTAYLDEAKHAVEWADIVVFSHPWVAPLIDDSALEGKFVVYDSHNVELDLREQLLERGDVFQSYVLDQVEAAEQQAGDRAHLILACSAGDAARFNEIYGWPLSRIELMPNGVFSQRIAPVTIAKKASLKTALNLPEGSPTAFFIGSDYTPNVEAAKILIEKLAPLCPEMFFVIAGGVCDRLPPDVPKNVRLAGHLSERAKVGWLNAADIAVNPMLSGSGTNIKMFDFAAAGLPIVSTPIGARGIVEASSYGVEICDPDSMAATLLRYASDAALRERAGAANRHLVESRFSWERLSPRLGQGLHTSFLRWFGLERRTASGRASIKALHISTVGQKCGIGEYTRHLMTEMDRRGFSSTVFTCETPLAPLDLRGLEGKASVGWFHDTVKYVDTRLADDIEALVEASDAELAIIQHHPGFLGEKDLRRLTRLLLDSGKRVALILHSLGESQIPLMKELAESGVTIIAHKREDLRLMHQYGLGALHLPLAIPTPPTTLECLALDKERPFTIASNGFLREHKRFDVIVDALALLRDVAPEARLRLLCPHYPSADSERAHAQVLDAIARNNLEDVVTLDTTYHDKGDLLLALSNASIAVFSYDESAEGGSAAAADAIAAGLPVIVSPSRIFDDLRDTAQTCPAQAETIAAALKDIWSDPAYYKRLVAQSRMYADRNSWEAVVDILFSVLVVPDRRRAPFSPSTATTPTLSSVAAERQPALGGLGPV
ncbi:FkbM family methyltransferase [Camelimonas sp. ID_303_24]